LSKAVRVPKSVDVKSDLPGFDQDLPDDQATDLDAAIQDAEAALVIALVNKVLVKALKRRFQIFTLNRKKNICGLPQDGAAPVLRPCLKKIIPAVTARFKLLLTWILLNGDS